MGGLFASALLVSASALSFLIVLLVVVIIVLHPRWRRSASTLPKTECHSRREERVYQRAMRRAARRRIILDFLARLGYLKSIETRVDEEKGAPLLGHVDEAPSPTMGDDISEFRNVAEIVGDMIAAEEGRSRHAPARCDPVSVPGVGVEELSSHVQAAGAHMAEEPPAYVDDDESSKGNVVDEEKC